MGLKPRQKQSQAVIVCTDKRGVFFGYTGLAPHRLMGHGPHKLRGARMAVYWSEAERGVFGLASNGPGAGCRIGPAVDIVLCDVHAVLLVSPEAVQRWESAPWKP